MNRLIAYLTDRFRELAIIPSRLTDIRQSIDKQTKAISAASERNNKNEQIQNEKFEKLLTKHDQPKTKEAAKRDPYYRVQNSIRWAAWCTCFAASFYGGVTYFQWQQSGDFNEAQNRPWLSPVEGGLKVTKTTSDFPNVTVGFETGVRNYGRSPAMYGLPKFRLYDMVNVRQVNAKPVESVLCDSIVGMEFTHEMATVFPGDSAPETLSANAYWEKVENNEIGKTPHGRPNTVIGCIGYSGSDTSKIYYTAVIYRVVKYASDDRNDGEKFFQITELQQLWVTPYQKKYACYFGKPCDYKQ